MFKCVNCYIEKELSYFLKDNKLNRGHRSKCRECTNVRQKELRNDNKEYISERRKQYYKNNIDKMREEKRKYMTSRKDYKKYKSEYDIIYRKKNSEKIAQYKKEWDNKKSQESIKYRIKNNLRRRIHHALKGKTKSESTIKLLGCSPEFFINHIESQFEKGMTWENYGDWHIDHIKPCFTFDLICPIQQKECFHYSNQRPLWKIDNLKRPKNIELESIFD